MTLTILGSGTCVPSKHRSSPANYIKIKKTEILVDCGSGTLGQIVKAGLDYKTIDIVCISHYHTDHISDLGAFLQALNWTPRFDRKKDLTIVGPKGFKSFFERRIMLPGTTPRPGTYKIIVKEISNSLTFRDFKLSAFKTPHSQESLAYSFIEGRKSLVISSDTDYDEGLAAFSKHANLMLLECAFANKDKVPGHLIPAECGKLAALAKTKKLVLTHVYPLGSGQKRLNETKKIFKNTTLAEDLMKLNI